MNFSPIPSRGLLKKSLVAALVLVICQLALARPPEVGEDDEIPFTKPALPGPKAGPAPTLLAPKRATTTPFLGHDVPLYDPLIEPVGWDGEDWKVDDDRLLESRFEKFLNAPATTDEEEKKYQAILESIMQKLAPGKETPASIAEAIELLSTAARFPQDGGVSAEIAQQIVNCRLAAAFGDRAKERSLGLEKERKRLEWNAQVSARTKLWKISASDDSSLRPLFRQMAEINSQLKKLRREEGSYSIQARLDFQALILQHFLQRRFQHVLMGTRFYRCVFPDGESKIQLGDAARALFATVDGLPPTLGTVDSLAGAIIDQARQGRAACDFLLEKSEVLGASNRLRESFIIGEHLPEIRGISREARQRVHIFRQDSARLAGAVAAKDFNLAAQLMEKLQTEAKDFEATAFTAAIETARIQAPLRLAKARNAAAAGDQQTSAAELDAALEIWPLNPDLASASEKIYAQAGTRNQALLELDRLLAQKNYALIARQQARFLDATLAKPEAAQRLQSALASNEETERQLVQSRELSKHGDHAAAWERIELAYRKNPGDERLQQLRADLTAQAAEFVKAIREAEASESLRQPGASLAWYIEAQRKYARSEIAREGIRRLTVSEGEK